jgi:carboxypeptidase family protein/TonB-dependent receptor-like protein
MRSLLVIICVFLLVSTAFAQSDRGTITGTVSDATSAVIPGANVTATNTQTQAKYETVSTETGNYTLAQLPAGVYELTVELPGFKKFTRQGITVQVAQTLRIDVALEVGAASEQVTVSADAPLLRTESGELSHNVTTSRLDDLPVLGIGTAAAGSSGIRNPLAVTQLIPGTYFQPNTNLRVNGAPVNSMAVRVEGQDSTNSLIPFAQAQTQPSVDSIQEVSIQTSNFAAEYGSTGGGVFNYTMKSGSNQFHGSAYDYGANEALNAGQPFTGNPATNPRQVSRRNDYGFTLGGPVRKDRTFFFFNFEQYREKLNINSQTFTVPTAAYRTGDFSQALTGRTLGTDPLGRTILEGAIYDPLTTRAAPDGRLVRDPFPGNIIPANRLDPVAVKIQAMVPAADTTGVVNNFHPSYPSDRVTTIPGVKIDHNLSNRQKLSFYWSRTATRSQYSPQFGGSDGLPDTITADRGTFIESHTERLNYDNTLSPTLLLHVGLGYQHNDFKDTAPLVQKGGAYNAAAELGLRGATLVRQFPQFTGLGGGAIAAARGGMKDMGPGAQSRSLLIKPTGNASLTWVKNNHTYKYGAEYRQDGFPVQDVVRTAGTFNFSAAQTGLPYVTLTGGTVNGGTVGFPYASFLLGLVNNGDISAPADTRLGKHQFTAFAQDTWKVTRTFTLDYGLRYDYFSYLQEQYGRLPNLSPATPNPAAGGRLGASIFEGDGPGRCNCNFASNYPWAFGPRLGAAWQVTPKWVVRAGWGVSYNETSRTRPAGSGSTNPFTAPISYEAAMRLQDGIPATIDTTWPKYNAGLFPVAGIAGNGAPVAVDPNAGRPARLMQWSLGVQRELTNNLVVEAAYVGSRGVWWTADGLKDLNALTEDRLNAFGLSFRNPADLALLTSQLSSPTAAQRGFNTPPYPGFPLNKTVAEALRPYPQFGPITSAYAPIGNTWYDALQLKATKRLSRGLDFTTTYTFQKELTLGADNENGGGVNINNISDVTQRNRNKSISQFSRPHVLVIAANYLVPAWNTNKIVSTVLKDWQFGTVLQYASGIPILAPYAQNNLNAVALRNRQTGLAGGGATFAERVPGQPLFLKDLNCHCYDPNKEFVLNPAAWVDPAPGSFGSGAAYYNDYRQQRRPSESMSLGRIFRITEGKTLQVRVEFSNVFNRAFIPGVLGAPDATNAKAPQTFNQSGSVASGFGRYNTALGFSNFLPRTGTFVARFNF